MVVVGMIVRVDMGFSPVMVLMDMDKVIILQKNRIRQYFSGITASGYSFIAVKNMDTI